MLRQKKQYQGPAHPWQGARILAENELLKRYGLRNKKEVWRAQSKLRNWRIQARKLVGVLESKRKEAQKPLFNKLIKFGLINEKSGIDDILTLTVEHVLGLRLQTMVHKLGISGTVKQARQLIVHKKVMINDVVTTAPSYEVKVTDKVALVNGFILKATPKPVADVEEIYDKAEVKENGE